MLVDLSPPPPCLRNLDHENEGAYAFHLRLQCVGVPLFHLCKVDGLLTKGSADGRRHLLLNDIFDPLLLLMVEWRRVQ